MSEYNAEYGIPAGDRDENATPEPIVLEPITIEPAREWQLPQSIRHYGTVWTPLTEEDANAAVAEFGTDELPALFALVRRLVWQSRQNIDADDFRLTHIWERAGEIADQKGYCGVFDEIMDQLGTGYERTIDVNVTVSVNTTVTIPVTMPRNADASEYIDTSDVEEALSNSDLSSYDWEVTGTEAAD